MTALQRFIHENLAIEEVDTIPHDGRYAGFLMEVQQSLGVQAANELFTKAQRQGKYINAEYDADLIDKVTYVISEQSPVSSN